MPIKFMKMLMVPIVAVSTLLALAGPGSCQSVSHVDEIGYYKYLAANRPELLTAPAICATTLLLKPRYRDAIRSGSDVASLMSERYSGGQHDEDERWAQSQMEMEASLPGKLPPNVAIAGYNPAFFVGYANNRPRGFYDANGICFKVFFELRNPTTDLTPQAYIDFVKALSNAGFVGDSKIPVTEGDIRFHYNNVIVHAVSKSNALLAEQVGTKFWGAKLENTARGVDVNQGNRPLDWHHYLCQSGGDLNALSPEALQYLYFR